MQRSMIPCAAILAVLTVTGRTEGQAAALPRSYAGVSVALAVYGGQSDNSELLDAAPVFGLIASHRFEGSRHFGVRASATLSPLTNASRDEAHDARTHMIVVTAGPVLEADLRRLTPYLALVVGAAATVSRGTTVREGRPGEPREVNETSVSPAWGLDAGLRFVLGTGAHPWAAELGARLIDMSTLTFVRPDTDTFERDPSLLELRVGVLVGL